MEATQSHADVTNESLAGQRNGDCSDMEPYEYSGGFRTFLLAASLISIIISSAIGNCLIFLIAYKKPSLLTIGNRYILHLAICQFIMTIMVMPYTLVSVFAQEWLFSCGWCDFTSFLKSILLSNIVLTLLLISVERYVSITAPMRYHGSIIVKYWYVLIIAVWITSVLVALPPMVGWSDIVYAKHQYSCSVLPGLGYVLFLFLFGFVSPMLMMGFIYLRIYFEAKKLIERLHPVGRPEKTDQKAEDPDQPRKDDRNAKKEKWVLDEWRVAKTGILAISAYAICWVPFFMVMVFYVGGRDRPWWLTMSTWMAMASCSINPYVYVFRSRSMRKQASQILSSMIGRDVFHVDTGSVTGQISRRDAAQSSSKSRYMKIPGFKKGNDTTETQDTTLTTLTKSSSMNGDTPETPPISV